MDTDGQSGALRVSVPQTPRGGATPPSLLLRVMQPLPTPPGAWWWRDDDSRHQWKERLLFCSIKKKKKRHAEMLWLHVVWTVECPSCCSVTPQSDKQPKCGCYIWPTQQGMISICLWAAPEPHWSWWNIWVTDWGKEKQGLHILLLPDFYYYDIIKDVPDYCRGGWTRWSLKTPSNPNHFMIQSPRHEGCSTVVLFSWHTTWQSAMEI